MRYPCLIPKRLCKMNIRLEMEQEGLNEYGEPLLPAIYTGKCNYQDKAKTIFTAEKKLVQITGVALFPGDICPQLPVITGGTADIIGEAASYKRVLIIGSRVLILSGKAILFGMDVKSVRRRIEQGIKARNPDGTVNYTEVMLI